MAKKAKALPLFAIVVLLIGITWLLTEMGIISTNIPWWPVILILVGANWIYEYYSK
ncbi:hypothetical protein ACFL5G_04690 [Candidatus Margulisiibacteriota bacterium]